ncbi:hypothetical protein L1049_012546 [Liquidambar formosana]|uniref:Protein BZR1 homolog n=1 Tax=Liquidambar formosana TaxID=63359 RepID=A0AAP0N4S4_LIQFO
MYGNYKLPKHCDNNEVLKALCNEAGLDRRTGRYHLPDASLWNAWTLWVDLHQRVHARLTTRALVRPLTQAQHPLPSLALPHLLMLLLIPMPMAILSSHGSKTSHLYPHQPPPPSSPISTSIVAPSVLP